MVFTKKQITFVCSPSKGPSPLLSACTTELRAGSSSSPTLTLIVCSTAPPAAKILAQLTAQTPEIPVVILPKGKDPSSAGACDRLV